MLKESLARYIQRDIDNVVNRMVLGREKHITLRFLSFGLRKNNRGEIEVTYRGSTDMGNPWDANIRYLGTVDLDSHIITGLDIDNHDFRDKVAKFLDDARREELFGIGVLNDTDDPPRDTDVDSIDLRIE